MNQEELKLLLDKYDNEYYNLDSSSVSDEVYDAIKAKYLLKVKKSEYDYVPGEALFNKYTHKAPIKSLKKVQITNKQEMRSMIKNLLPVTIQPKFDGLTLVIYNDAIVTRGNGEIGEDVTDNAITISGIKDLMKDSFYFRGEALIEKDIFQQINNKRILQGLEPFKNARNAAAGMLRNKDSAKIEGLSFYGYDVINSRMTSSTQIDLIEELAKEDVKASMSITFEDVDSAINYIESFDRNNLNYDIDGLVVKSNQVNSMDVFGSTAHSPNNAFAIKFKTEAVWTKLLRITNQVGRTGAVTPVAELAPIEFMGSTISRATLHNYGVVKALGLNSIFSGGKTMVKITKANEIIPQILEMRQEELTGIQTLEFKVVPPKCCPECNNELQAINDQLFCINHLCPAKLVGNTIHLAKREALDIQGLSEATVIKLKDAKLINHPFDIFTLTKEDILNLPGFAEKSANNLYHYIQKATSNIDLKNFLYAAGLPNVGKTVSEDIANKLLNYDAIIKDIEYNDSKIIASIDGVGVILLESIKTNRYLWKNLKTYVTPLDVELPKTNNESSNKYTIVVTGTFDIPRKQIEEQLKGLGQKIGSAVSKNTDFVLAGEKAGSKLTKANELGIKIITDLDHLLDLLK